MDINYLVRENLPAMTASQLKVANGLLLDPSVCLFSSIDQAAKQLNVSTATIVRFAKLIGFHGYSELQQMLRSQYKQNFEPLDRLNAGMYEMDSSGSPFYSVYLQQRKLIESLYTPEMEEMLRSAADMLCKARRIYTLGARGSFACSYYLGHHLNRILGNCDILEDNARLSDRLLQIKPDDVLLVINQPRYSKRIYHAAEVIRTTGAHVIAVSDTLISPYYHLADVFIAVPTKSIDFHNSMLASMMIAEILIAVIATLNKPILQDHLKRMEHIFDKLDIFM